MSNLLLTSYENGSVIAMKRSRLTQQRWRSEAVENRTSLALKMLHASELNNHLPHNSCKQVGLHVKHIYLQVTVLLQASVSNVSTYMLLYSCKQVCQTYLLICYCTPASKYVSNIFTYMLLYSCKQVRVKHNYLLTCYCTPASKYLSNISTYMFLYSCKQVRVKHIYIHVTVLLQASTCQTYLLTWYCTPASKLLVCQTYLLPSSSMQAYY